MQPVTFRNSAVFLILNLTSIVIDCEWDFQTIGGSRARLDPRQLCIQILQNKSTINHNQMY